MLRRDAEPVPGAPWGDVDEVPLVVPSHELIDVRFASLAVQDGVVELDVRDWDHGFSRRDVLPVGKASLEVAHVGALIRDDQGPLELARVLRVDPEVRRQLHRTPDAGWHVGEGAVAEHGGVQGREEIVVERHDGSEPPPDEVRVLLHGVGERREDDPELVQLRFERRRDGDAVEHRVHRDPRQRRPLLEGDAELLVHRFDLRVHFVVVRGLLLRCRVVVGILVVDRAVVDVRPLRLLHREPVTVGTEPPLEEPLRFVLLLGDVSHDVLAEALRGELLLDVRDEAVLVLALGGDLLFKFRLRDHAGTPNARA